jgi:hypothetical protein
MGQPSDAFRAAVRAAGGDLLVLGNEEVGRGAA